MQAGCNSLDVASSPRHSQLRGTHTRNDRLSLPNFSSCRLVPSARHNYSANPCRESIETGQPLPTSPSPPRHYSSTSAIHTISKQTMRFSFLTAIVAVASVISVTAGRSTCSPVDGSCTKNSDCCGQHTSCAILVSGSILVCIQLTHLLLPSPRVTCVLTRLQTRTPHPNRTHK